MYIKSAQLYDKLYHFKDYKAHSKTVIEAIRRAHPTASTLLEAACGTGLFTEQFSTRYAVEGMDISQEMLDVAATRLPGVPLHLGDMVDFDLGRKFDVVACLFRSIAYVRTEANLFQTIRSFAQHVLPGGIIVIEPFFTPDTYWVDRITMNLVQEPDLKVAWMYVSELVEGEAHLNIHYTVGTPAGVSHFTELHRMALFTPQQYAEAFRQSGFEISHDSVGPTSTGLYVGHRDAKKIESKE